MRDVIEAGGSVKYKGKLITRVDQLFKVNGTEAEKTSEIDSLKARLAELEGGNSEVKTEEKSADASHDETLEAEKKRLKKLNRSQLTNEIDELNKSLDDDQKIVIAEGDTNAEIVEKILAKGK